MVAFLAHVKWFVDDPAQVKTLGSIEWLAVIGIVLSGLCVFWVLDRLLARFNISPAIDTRLSKYKTAIPYIVRFSTALLLLFNVIESAIFAPNIAIESSPIGYFISWLSVVVALLLITGFRLQVAGVILIGMYVLALLTIEQTSDVVDHVEYLGIGLYFALRESKTYLALAKKSSMKRFLSPEALLRIGVGLSFVSLAFSEKLVGIANSYQFIASHDWNILRFIGVSDRWFIIFAGAMELLVGLALVLNLAPRIVTLMVLGLMTITAALLGLNEVFGHLFALSLIAIVWINPYANKAGKSKKL